MRLASSGRLVLLAAMALLTASVPALGAQDADLPPGLTVRLSSAPVEHPDPRSQVAMIALAEPGTSLTWQVEVGNGDDVPLPLEIYAADARADEDWVVEAGRGTSDVAGWITTSPASLVVAPYSRELVEVTITVPADASGGERYAAVVAEPPPRAGGVGSVVTRVGVRVYLSVDAPPAIGEEPFEPLADFRIDTLQAVRAEDGTPGVLVGVTNTGNTVVDVTGQLLLRDGPGGITAGPFPVALGRTLGPGFSGEVTVPLDPEIPLGPWLAVASLASGEVQRQAQATITLPPNPGEVGDVVPASPYEAQRRVLLPVAAVLWSLSLGGVVLLISLRRRDRKAEALEATQQWLRAHRDGD